MQFKKYHVLFRVILGFLLVVRGASVCAQAIVIPVSKWKITRQMDADVNKVPVCKANADYALFPEPGLKWHVQVVMSRSGEGALNIDVEPTSPHWIARVGSPVRVAKRSRLSRVMVEGSTPHEYRGTEQGLKSEIHFPAKDQTLSLWRPGRWISIIDPSLQGDEAIKHEIRLWMESDGGWALGMAECLRGEPIAATVRVTTEQTAPVDDLAEISLQLGIAFPGDSTLAVELPPASLASLILALRFENVRAYNKARDTFEVAIRGLPRAGPGRIWRDFAQGRLARTYLRLEMPDEAVLQARELPDRIVVENLALIMKGERELADGIPALETVLAHEINVGPSRALLDMATRDQSLCIGLPADKRARAKALLLEWAEASAGLEAWTRPDRIPTQFLTRPAWSLTFQLATIALGCIAPDDIVATAAESRSSSLDQARAALLRAEGLRRYGALGAVDHDLRYARFQIDQARGPDILRWSVELAQARLLADDGRDLKALSLASSLLQQAERSFGVLSEPAAEAGSLVAELTLRDNRPADAELIAFKAIMAARENLSQRHSQVSHLWRLLAACRRAQGEIPGAADALASAVGIDGIAGISKATTRPMPPATVVARVELESIEFDVQDLRDQAGGDLAAMMGKLQLIVAQEKWDSRKSLDSASEERRLSSLGEFAPGLAERLIGAQSNLQVIDRSIAAKNGFVSLGDFGIKSAVNRWLDVANALPSDLMPRLRQGADTALIERILNAYRNSKQSPLPERSNDLVNLHLALAQAMFRDGSSAAIAARRLSENIGNGSSGANAIAEDLYERRIRGRVDALIKEVGAHPDRAAILRPEIVNHYLITTLNHEGVADELRRTFDDTAAHAFQHGIRAIYGSVVSVDSLRKALRPRDAIVVWIPLEHSTYVVVVTSNRAVVRVIPVGRMILIRQVSAVMNAVRLATEDIRQQRPVNLSGFPWQVAYDLHELLFSGIANDLPGVDHLYLAQLGPLAGIPFGLLVTAIPTAGGVPRWLADEYSITRMPALVDIGPSTVSSARIFRMPPVVAFGPPATGIDGTAVETRGASDDFVNVSDLPPLPAAEAEVLSVARAASLHGGKPQVFVGKEATHDVAMARLRGLSTPLLLFATHGLTPDDGTGEAALVLSPSGLKGDSRRLLRSSEIAGLHLDVDLTILSACSSVVESGVGGDSLSGLATAFLVAGSREVIATHWPVSDFYAHKLIALVAEHRFSGNLDSTESLRSAQAALRSSRLSAHPVFWAAYELIGIPSRP